MLPLGKYKYIFMLCKLALEDNDVSKKQPSSKAKQISNNSQGHLVELLPRIPPYFLPSRSEMETAPFSFNVHLLP